MINFPLRRLRLASLGVTLVVLTVLAFLLFPSEMAESQESTANTPATGTPTISGTARVEETLTVDTAGIADPFLLTGSSPLHIAACPELMPLGRLTHPRHPLGNTPLPDSAPPGNVHTRHANPATAAVGHSHNADYKGRSIH